MIPVYSIVIPVYNAQEYLDACVQSVLNQKSDAPVEIILVNDGSRDGSAAICDRYAAQDPRVQVIHQENQGVSVARNAGIRAAQGEYLLFLDSDDLWDENLLVSIDQLVSRQPDMIDFGCCYFTDSGAGTVNCPTCIADGEDGDTYFFRHEQQGVVPLVSACMAAFRRQFLLDNGLAFPVGVAYGEDFTLCMHCLKYAKSIYTVSQPLYRVRVNENSVTHTPNLKKIRDILSVCAGMYRLHPGSLLADYYAMSVWTIEGLTRKDAQQVYDLLEQNRDILKQVRGTRAKLACGLYSAFGWYGGAKALRFLANARKSIKG